MKTNLEPQLMPMRLELPVTECGDLAGEDTVVATVGLECQPWEFSSGWQENRCVVPPGDDDDDEG